VPTRITLFTPLAMIDLLITHVGFGITSPAGLAG
jgi:hypothetical protein